MRPRLPFRSARVALLLLVSTTAIAASETPDCAQGFLEELGWRFVATDATAARIEPGTPCDRADLPEAQAAGDLVVHIPRGLDANARVRLNESLLHHPATICAYGFALGAATRRAVDHLAANPDYRFSFVQFGWIGFGPTGPGRDGWESVASFGRGYQPRGANSRAIEAFYTGKVRSECGVGRQIAQYATQFELYGREGFDAEFEAEEIVIGTFNKLRPSRSILLGTTAGPFTHDGRAVAAAKAGRQAFMGLPGYIEHVFDRSKLDDINNQAENFVVYDVGAEAAAALRRRGGFAYYNQRNQAIWSLARSLTGHKSSRYFERLLVERDPALRAELSAQDLATVELLDAELADPFYREFQIYVHKQGVKPVSFHIARLLDRNPRTPFRIELSLHNLHTTLYDRYLAYRLEACRSRGI